MKTVQRDRARQVDATMKQTEYNFSTDEIESQLRSFAEKGITELVIHDKRIGDDKKLLLRFFRAVARDAPNLYVSVPVNPEILTAEVCRMAEGIFCSLDIPLTGVAKQTEGMIPVYLFDKKFYARKATVLNDSYLVWGFTMDWAILPGDSLKMFRDRLDFALSNLSNLRALIQQLPNLQVFFHLRISRMYAIWRLPVIRFIHMEEQFRGF